MRYFDFWNIIEVHYKHMKKYCKELTSFVLSILSRCNTLKELFIRNYHGVLIYMVKNYVKTLISNSTLHKLVLISVSHSC